MVNRTEQAAAKYHGETASGYEARRREQPKWKAEDAIIKGMLSKFPPETSILDVPVGTGRFIPFYELMGFKVLGLDVSEDMLIQARDKVRGSWVKCRQGNILAIESEAKSHDVAVAIRIMNKIGSDDVPAALRELQRVSRETVIFNVRIWTPGCRWRHALPFEVVTGAIEPDWQIAEDMPIHEPDFRMVRLQHHQDAEAA